MRLLFRFLPLYLVIFIGFLGYSMTLPLFTTMVMDGDPIVPTHLSLGQRTTLLGLLLTVYPLGQFFGSPILGALSDRYGRKRVLVTSLLLSSIFYVGIALSLTIHNLTLLFATLFLAGLTEGNIALAQSSIAEEISGHKRRSAFGMIYTVAGVAYMIGPLVGGVLSSSAIVSWFGYDTPFWAVLLFLIACFFWIAATMKERPPKQASLHLFHAFTSLRTVVTNRALRPYYLINFLIYMALYGFARAFPIYAVERFDLPTLLLSLFIAYTTVPILIANTFVVPRIPHSWDPLRLAATAAFLMALSMLIVILPGSPNSFWITLFPVCFFLAICQTEVASVISTKASSESLGQVMGNNQSLQVGAEALSASLAGLVAAMAIYAPFWLFALMGAVGGALLLFLRARSSKSQSDQC